MKTTLLTNIYNEEYLLPFWLNHHKDMFDDIIIIDYRSTDKSIEICKTICPNCTIITTKNKYYDASDIDIEFMEIETKIDGIKVVLNTTEFLFITKPIKEIFNQYNTMSFAVHIIAPYSKNIYEIDNYYDLFHNLLNDDIVYDYDRGHRYIHRYYHGSYFPGRHFTRNDYITTNDMYIIWLGFYPLNEKLLKRKLQIGKNISLNDKNLGHGVQHFYTREQILAINEEKSNTGKPLKELNLILYDLLNKL